MRKNEWEQYLERARAQHGDRFDPSGLAPQFIPYFRGPRIRVRTIYREGEAWLRTGRVGITTGWKPVFLLMHRSSNIGSSDVLSARDTVEAVQRGRKYEPVRSDA